MNTAIKTLIEEIESCYDNMEEEHTQTKTLKWIVQQIKNRYLELEKKQIVDAYNQGFRDGESIEDTIKIKGDIANFAEAEQYYNSTFTNQ